MTDIIEQWNTKTIGGTNKLVVDDFELIQDNIHLQETNMNALEIVDLIGRITNNRSNSGPIPKTVTLEAQTFYIPGLSRLLHTGVGEVWQIMGVSVASSSGLSGSGVIEVDISNNTTNDRLIIADFNFTSSSDFPVIETSIGGAVFFVDENHRVRLRAEGTFTSINNVTLGLVRVR